MPTEKGSGTKNGTPLRGLKETLGRRVWELRRRRGYTQEDMAKRMKLHWTYIGGLERGERNPNLSTMVRAAEGLGVRLVDLLDDRRTVQPLTARERREANLLRFLRKRDDGLLVMVDAVARQMGQRWEKIPRTKQS
jgi:transcriptional regulator with XRE-family HTH domain